MAIKPGVAETADGSYEFYWNQSTGSFYTDDFFTSNEAHATSDVLSGVKYGEMTFENGALKLDSKGWLSFTPETTGTLVVVHAPRQEAGNDIATFGIYNGETELKQFEPNGFEQVVSTYHIDSVDTTYTIKRDNKETHLFYAKFTPDDSSTEGGGEEEEELADIDTSKYYTIKNAVSKRYISYSSTSYTNGNIYSDFEQVNDASGNSCKFKFEDAGDGYYYIQVFDDRGNNYYLEAYFKAANNRYLKATTKEEDNENQKFKVIVNSDGTLYKIMNNSGHAIDANAGNDKSDVNIYASGDRHIDNQQFVFEETDPPAATIDTNKEYAIMKQYTNRYLTYSENGITQTDSVGGKNCKFAFEEAGGGLYYIRVLTDGLATNYLEAAYTEGTNVGLNLAAKDENNANQKFKLIKNSNGTYTIACTGGAIDAHSNGTSVSTYRLDTTNKNQQFVIAELPDESAYYKIKTSGGHYLKYNADADRFVQVSEENSDDNSCKFRFESVGEGVYYIDSLYDGVGGKYINVPGNNKLNISDKVDATKQQFKITNNNDSLQFFSQIEGKTGMAIDANQKYWADISFHASIANYITGENADNANRNFTLVPTTYTPPETPVVTTTAATTEPTVTTTVTVVKPNQVYEINVNNGKAGYQLAVDDNNMLIQDAEADAGKTHFKFEGPDEEGYYLIKNLETGKYLTLTGTTPKISDSINLEDYNYLNDLNRQKFKIVADENNTVNFVSKYSTGEGVPLVINASHSTGVSDNQVTIYPDNPDDTRKGNKRFTLVESTYEVDTKINGTITGNGNPYTIEFSQPADVIYIYVELNGGTSANGNIGMSVNIGNYNYKWAEYPWSVTESGYIAIELNNFKTDGFDEATIQAIREAITQQPFNGQANIWYSDNNAKFTDAYIMNDEAVNNTPEYKPIESGNVRIEARVIFGDYNDDGTHTFNNVTPKPNFNLYSLDDGVKTLRETNESNVVSDASEARKDWCYQYNYYWDVAPIDDEGNNSDSGYYIELTGYDYTGTSDDGIPTVKIGDEWYKVYYLRDDFLGHPGNNTVNAPINGEKENDRNAEYNSDPSKTFRNDSGAIYIYLDPLTDWQWNKEEHPATVNITMKKRWDGHNSGGYRNRPKEKIKIQLQRWNGSQWVEYTDDYNGENYYNWCYYEVTDAAGKKHFVNKSAAGGVQNIYSIPNSDDYTDKEGNDNISAENLKYEKLTAEQLDPASSDDRIKLYLDYTKWNNIVLTLDGDNHPQHFDNGYYYKWNNLPYGQYRVVETQSFYDSDDNDQYNEGVDRNTASEYYYMSFPPSRDSDGVLHIQNFTKDMVIEVQKEWYDDQGKTKIDKTQKTVNFKVYRSTAMLKNPTAAQLGDPIYTLTTDSNGHLLMKTTDTEHDYSKLKLKDDNDRKYYYYIQEVSVEGVSADEYTLKNGNSEGFVRSTNGSYYIDYEGGDARKFFIQNKVKVGITLNKEWYTDKNSNSKMTFAEGSEPNAEFEIYVSDRLGTPLYDNGAYKVNYEYYTGNSTTGKSTQAITYIADAKIDETGKLEIIGGDINDGNGTSKVMSNQLHIYGTEEVFNGTKTFNADATTKGVFEPQNAPWQKENDYYILPGNKDNRLYVKPRHGFGGILELTFEKVQDTDHIRWFDGDNKYLNEFDDYESGKDLVVTYQMYDGDNKYICRTGVEGTTVPRLKSAVFYPYNYYYIREKTGDTCELINGDSNGFVKNGDDTYYTQITAANRTPTVTAKNTPKNTELDINKEWYTAETDGIVLEDLSKSATFEIYKGYQQGKPTKDGNDYKVNSETLTKLTYIEGLTYNNGFTTNEKGELNATNLPAYEKIGDEYKKVYYYVREVDGDYKLITEGAANGFIADGAGNYGSFFDESNISETEIARTYTFKNVPQLKLQVQKTWAQDKTTGNEVKVHLYRSTDLSVANIERGNMKTSAPTAQTELDETDNTATKTLSAGVYRAGTMNRMLAKLESDESITTLGQVISNEEVPVVYNSLKTLAEDNIDGYYVETLTIKSADSWKYTKTLPVYDNTGALYYYWVVEDVDSAAGYNVDYSSSDNDSDTSNCINADNSGGGIIQVINSLEVIVILPETGGSGTHGYTAAGGIVVLLSAAVLLLKRRKRTL